LSALPLGFLNCLRSGMRLLTGSRLTVPLWCKSEIYLKYENPQRSKRSISL
jgi:hypothetical protein